MQTTGTVGHAGGSIQAGLTEGKQFHRYLIMCHHAASQQHVKVHWGREAAAVHQLYFSSFPTACGSLSQLGPIIVPCCSSLYGSLYSHATLSLITSDSLWHPADTSSDHLRKLCSLKLSCEPGGIRSAQTAVPLHIITLVLSLALLWVHSVCCSGQWGVGATQSSNSHSPPAPPTHPPTHRHCNLCWYYAAWQRPWVTKSTADSVSLNRWVCVLWGWLNDES